MTEGSLRWFFVVMTLVGSAGIAGVALDPVATEVADRLLPFPVNRSGGLILLAAITCLFALFAWLNWRSHLRDGESTDAGE
jgi:TRAP-type C4-dicarboxylate transport system permease small subunit